VKHEQVSGGRRKNALGRSRRMSRHNIRASPASRACEKWASHAVLCQCSAGNEKKISRGGPVLRDFFLSFPPFKCTVSRARVKVALRLIAALEKKFSLADCWAWDARRLGLWENMAIGRQNYFFFWVFLANSIYIAHVIFV